MHKEIHLGKISTFLFSNKIILSLDEKWINHFDCDKITFQSLIKDGKYFLEGPPLKDTSKLTAYKKRGFPSIV